MVGSENCHLNQSDAKLKWIVPGHSHFPALLSIWTTYIENAVWGFSSPAASRLSNGNGPGEVLGAWMDIFSQYYVTNSLGPMTNDKKRVDESSEIKKEPRVKRDYSSLTRHRWCFPRALIFIVFFSFVRWWDAVKLTIFEKLRLLPCFPCAVTEQ